jgi:hypothetical protein
VSDVRKIGFHRKRVTSLHDELNDSARRILLACVPTTMSFWVDDKSDIHGDVPDKVPRAAEVLIVGTYGLGTSLADIEADLRTERCERAKTWATD